MNKESLNKLCSFGGCVEVVEVTNRAGESEFLLRSNLSGSPKGNVEILTEDDMKQLVTAAATPDFAEKAFSEASQANANGEALFFLNNPTGIKAGERPVFTADEVKTSPNKIKDAAIELKIAKPKRSLATAGSAK